MNNMPTGYWCENTASIITITADATSKVEADYKKRGSSTDFEKFGAEFINRNYGVWELTATLAAGEYVVRYKIDNEIAGYAMLKVVPLQEYSAIVNTDIIKSAISDAVNKIIAEKLANGIG